MSTQPSIERRPLLAAALDDWPTTKVDVRSIRFGPGQQTGVHSHPCHVVGYIAEGAAILQVDGQPAQRLETGTAFHEPAGARILRFDNASATDPLHFIATYLLLYGDQPLIEMLA
ncbi:MAG TPA: cupin domain-containing protein [Methylomirabilota bacterium]|jgi:quercetin dioxygenase-like cupin family protein